MALSRPFLLALLGVALLGATFFAVTNARNKAADDSAPAAQQTADPGSTPAQATPEPRRPPLLRSCCRPASPLTRSRAPASTAPSRSSSQGEKNTIKTSGAFEIGGAKEMPKVDVQVSVDVPGFDGARRLRDHRRACLVHAR